MKKDINYGSNNTVMQRKLFSPEWKLIILDCTLCVLNSLYLIEIAIKFEFLWKINIRRLMVMLFHTDGYFIVNQLRC